MKDAHEIHTDAADTNDPAQVLVRARKYDGRIHRSWHGRLREQKGSLIVVDAEFDREIRHPLLGTILAGTRSAEFYWTNRWYNIFRFAHSDGSLRNFYCNVNTPAILRDGVLDFTDLDIDVLVAPDFKASVLDEDEFARHTIEFGYSEDVRDHAHAALAELLKLIERREFPFDSESPISVNEDERSL